MSKVYNGLKCEEFPVLYIHDCFRLLEKIDDYFEQGRVIVVDKNINSSVQEEVARRMLELNCALFELDLHPDSYNPNE